MDEDPEFSRNRLLGGDDADGGDDDVPMVGMEFDSVEAAGNFYHRYSAKVGFSVRVCNTKLKDGVVTHRKYCCSRQGFRQPDRRDDAVAFHRAETRCGCDAHFAVKMMMNGKYLTYKFDSKHNHELVNPKNLHFLRSHRRVFLARKAEAEKTAGPGASSNKDMELMDFIPVNLKNYLRTKRRTPMKKGEAGAVLEYFRVMQSRSPSSFYAIQLDENELMTNMFWADPKMMVDYYHFGDVVCFDTTYKTCNESRPLALFLGVNHHKQLVVFGAALLFDDTMSTFEWLFETFVKAMGGKQPKTILTDHNAAMDSAISSVFPGICHRLCVWHVHENSSIHLHDILKKNPNFAADFRKCLFDYYVAEEFELAWTSLIQKYHLLGNIWFQEMSANRERWALVYRGETFSADIANTQKTDNFSAGVKKHLNSRTELWHFFEAFEKMLDERRYRELQSDFEMSQSTPYLRVQWKLLKHAASTYTPTVFKVLEKEIIEILDLQIVINHVDGTSTEYKVSDSDHSRAYTVFFDDSSCSFSCSCRMYESEGIFCRHLLKVLEVRNMKYIPEHYIMKRWTRKAKDGVVGDSHGVLMGVDPKVQLSVRYRNLCPMLVQLAMKASFSDDTSRMVSDFTVKMMEEIDNHLAGILLHRSQATKNADVGCVTVENMEPMDGSSEDDESLIDEEGDNEYQVVECSKGAKESDESINKDYVCRVRCCFETSKTKKPRNTSQTCPKSSPIAQEPRLQGAFQSCVLSPGTAISSMPDLQPRILYKSNAELTSSVHHMFQPSQVIYGPAYLNLNNLPPQIINHGYPGSRQTPARQGASELVSGQLGGPYCYNQRMQEQQLLVSVYEDHTSSSQQLIQIQGSGIGSYENVVPGGTSKLQHDSSKIMPK